MDRKAVTETLRDLSTGKGRSKAAQLREILGDVEAAFAAGVTHAAVVEALKKHGLDMTLGTFQATLKRLRAQDAKRSQTHPPKTSPSTPPPAATGAAATAPAADAPPSHDPRDLDAIFRSTPDLAALSRIARQRRNKPP